MGQVELKWVSGQVMLGTDSTGHPLVIGKWSPESPEWVGLKPSELLLLAAASCSMWDVVSILNKQREPLAGLDVTCTGQQQAEPPHAFTGIHLHYTARGPVSAERLARAIELSQDKYCSVINTLRPAARITHDYEITA